MRTFSSKFPRGNSNGNGSPHNYPSLEIMNSTNFILAKNLNFRIWKNDIFLHCNLTDADFPFLHFSTAKHKTFSFLFLDKVRQFSIKHTSLKNEIFPKQKSNNVRGCQCLEGNNRTAQCKQSSKEANKTQNTKNIPKDRQTLFRWQRLQQPFLESSAANTEWQT